MYVYIQSAPGLYTCGFYSPDGQWHAESDHSDKEDAAKRTHYLNGGALDPFSNMYSLTPNELRNKFGYQDQKPTHGKTG